MSDPDAPRPIEDLGRLFEVLSSQAEATRRIADLIESTALPLLERIAVALERVPSTASTEEPGRPRRSTVDDLRGRLEAARQANDPDGAIRFRDELAPCLEGDALLELDRSLVKWLMILIQRRLRTGTVGAEVVALAGRIAESFGATAEGASLRASMPTLRRSAGLCPVCAEPYTGVLDACPKCLLTTSSPTLPMTPPVEGEPGEDDPDAEMIGDPIDLNNERFWQDP